MNVRRPASACPRPEVLKGGEQSAGANEDTRSAIPMALRLGPAEISVLRDAIAAYMTVDMWECNHPILDDLYRLFASWEQGVTPP